MIVTCENCNTRFNLDENLIKESGSKVRCSKCNHTFTVHKSVPVEEPESAVGLEEAPADFPDSPEAPLSSLEAEEAPEEAAMVSEEAPEEALDLDLSEAEEKPAEEEIPPEAIGLEEEPAAEEPTPAEEEVAIEETPEAMEEALEEAAMVSEEALDLDLSEAEEKPAEEEIPPEAIGLEEEPAAEEPTPAEEEVAIEETPEAVEMEAVIEEAEAKEELEEELADAISVESLEGAEEEETEQLERKQPVQEIEEELMPPPVAPVAEKEPRARRRISTPLMIMLALVLLAGGAFAAYSLLKSFDVKIPFLESLAGAPESATIDPGNLRILLLDQLIRSEFVENRTDGRLFVIKGKVRNDYPEARNFIMVRGTLYSNDGETIDKKTIYCGNALSDTDLKALDKATIDRRLRNRFGDKRSNFSVPSGKVIPFVVVFSDLPKDLGEFSVEVVSSAPG